MLTFKNQQGFLISDLNSGHLRSQVLFLESTAAPLQLLAVASPYVPFYKACNKQDYFTQCSKPQILFDFFSLLFLSTLPTSYCFPIYKTNKPTITLLIQKLFVSSFSWGYSSYNKPASINHMKLSLRGNLTTFHFNLSNTRRGPKA